MKQFLLPFNPGNSQNEIQLTGRDFHYLCRVRRYGAGSRFPAMAPDGRRFELEITEIAGKKCMGILHELDPEPAGAEEENTPQIFLIAALTKGRKMDLTVRQAVEAGAAGLFPVFSEYSQVRPSGDDGMTARMKRWERIAGEALQQCGGRRALQLEEPVSLEAALEIWAKRGPLLFLHEKSPDTGRPSGFHSSLAPPVRNLAIIAGPEGGLSPKEVNMLLARGGRPVYLGERVLRAETAAIYGLAAAATIIRERCEWQPV